MNTYNDTATIPVCQTCYKRVGRLMRDDDGREYRECECTKAARAKIQPRPLTAEVDHDGSTYILEHYGNGCKVSLWGTQIGAAQLCPINDGEVDVWATDPDGGAIGSATFVIIEGRTEAEANAAIVATVAMLESAA